MHSIKIKSENFIYEPRYEKICICENKDTDQLRSDCEADQRLCFRYMDSTIPLLSKSKFPASCLLLCMYSLVGNPKKCFLMSKLIFYNYTTFLEKDDFKYRLLKFEYLFRDVKEEVSQLFTMVQTICDVDKCF